MAIKIRDFELQFEVYDDDFHFSGGFGWWRFVLCGDAENIKRRLAAHGGLAAKAADILDGEEFARQGFYVTTEGEWKFYRPPAADLDGRVTGVVFGENDPILWGVQVDGHPREQGEEFVLLHCSEARRLSLATGDRISFTGEYSPRFGSYIARKVRRQAGAGN